MAIVGKDDHMQNVTCSIDGCERTGKLKRTWCAKHYDRWLKYGDPEHPVKVYAKTPEESFAMRTQREDGCLVWTGLSHNGYGLINVNNKHVPIHRWVFERERGTIPAGHVIDHICRNTACCEITHLRLATRKQNAEHLASEAPGHSSRYRGVSFDKQTGRWSVSVMHNRKLHWGGRHATEEQAAAAAAELRNRLFTHNDIDRKKNRPSRRATTTTEDQTPSTTPEARS